MKMKRIRKSLNVDLTYKSPLTCFQTSLEESVIDNLVRPKCTKRTKNRVSRNKIDRQNTNCTSLDSSQNSIIVINSDDEANNTNRSDTSLCSDSNECYRMTNTSLSQHQNQLSNERLHSSQSKRQSVILLDNDSSFVHLSDTQKSEEIIAKTEDDVIELWSCLRNVKVNNKNIKKRSQQCINNVLDTRPNMENLKYLGINIVPALKKRKICTNSDKTVLFTNSMTQIKPKHSKENQRKRKKQYNNMNSNSNKQCSNVQYNERIPKPDKTNKKCKNVSNSKDKLREIIVDGCNVAKMYTRHKNFSETGIKLVVDYFKSRGHTVKVFLPNYIRRKKYSLLEKLYKKGIVIFTPSRHIDGRKIIPYDDRYILEYATKCKGIVISSDQYRDLYQEKPEWRDTILNRLLSPTFVGDYVMFPEDPLGKSKPNLETFLRLE